jgi:hypothetical protein
LAHVLSEAHLAVSDSCDAALLRDFQKEELLFTVLDAFSYNQLSARGA